MEPINAVEPTEQQFLTYARSAAVVPVYVDVPADTETPISVYQKLVGDGAGFLLESVEQGARLGRYSFIGCGVALRLQVRAGQIDLAGDPQLVAAVSAAAGDDGATDPFAAVQAVLAACPMPNVPGLPRFAGGLAGYIGFEASRSLHGLGSATKAGAPAVPEADLLAPELLVAFDHVRGRVKLIAPAFVGTDPAAAYRQAVARIQAAAAALARGVPVPLNRAAAQAGTAVANQTRAEFEDKVRHVQQLIADGEAGQIVISLRLAAPFRGDAFAVYRQLRSLNPSPYMFYFNFGSLRLAGASPEMLVRVEDGLVEVRPIAGTRPRGANAAEDARLAADLLQDRKERAEHAMLVDLAQEEVGRISVPGSVYVENFMHVEHYSHVMHLVSDVKGKLRADCDAVAALKASFPAGTVSGSPKARALQAIAELEPERGVYAGAVGYFGFQGNMDTCIAIRTVVFHGDEAWVQAGAGIVADSVPAREYDECLHKARALLQALGAEVAPSDEARDGDHAAAPANAQEVTA